VTIPPPPLKPWEGGFELHETFNMVSLLLERHLGPERGRSVAIITPREKITYGRLGRLTNRVGNLLLELGLGPGERIILLLHDSPWFVAAFLGAMKIGAVPVPCNVMATPRDWAYFINDSRAKAVIVEDELQPKLAQVLPQCPLLSRILIKDSTRPEGLDLQERAARASDRLDPAPTRAQDHSYWLYTSGTTGQPKGVIHLHRDLVYAVETWGRHVVDFQPHDRVYCVSRLFFSYGLNNGLYLPLYFGGQVILSPERPLPETVVRIVETNSPTLLFSVPTSYGQILNHLEDSPTNPDFSSLRACVSAGEALPASLSRRWKDRFGLEILDGLGSSEVGFIYICNLPGKAKPNSSGVLLPGYEARLLDDDGRELPRGEVGHLWVRSPTLAAGYWNKPEQTKAAFVGGWMRTGDRCCQDEDGFFFYFGRSDDALKVSGIWVSPLEVEAVLLEHPDVAEAAVVGHRDRMGLVKPKAFVTLMPGREPGEKLTAELQNLVKTRLAPYKYPRWIEYLAELPKTATGKIQRYKLRQDSNPSGAR